MIPETNAATARVVALEDERDKLLALIRSIRAATRAHTFILTNGGAGREHGLSLLDKMDAALGTNAAGEPIAGGRS